HGKQNKEEKFWFMRVFCDISLNVVEHFDPRIGVFNGAANTGFDIPNVKVIVREGFPTDLANACQEVGRAGRSADDSGKCTVCGSMASFLKTRHLIHNPKSDPGHFNCLNVSFDVGSKKSEESDEAHAKAEEETIPDLTAQERRLWQEMQSKHQLEVLKFYCLDLGCKQLQKELFLSSGTFRQVPNDFDDDCHKCPVCRMKYKSGDKSTRHNKIFRNICRLELVRWLESDDVRKVLVDMPASYDHRGDSLTDLLWKGPNSDQCVLSIAALTRVIQDQKVCRTHQVCSKVS
ncbi:hypothetical protein THAOC_14552, partial [Thalassiosira oceanica]